jgi:hypothetical protein
MMEEKLISSAEELHRLASGFANGHPIFRGVSDASYQLLTRFGRSVIHVKKLRETNPNVLFELSSAHELAVLRDFIKLSAPYLTFSPIDEWEWLSVAQHHGLPTRMMDWTKNPLVAAYFAIQNYRRSMSDCAIYVVDDHYKLDCTPLDKSPFELEKAAVFHPRHITPRITAQLGLFTVHPESQLEQPFYCEGMEKWIIAQECRIEIKLMLIRYGITAASLFPGLDGITESLRDDYWL